jgi:hypothetical protein
MSRASQHRNQLRVNRRNMEQSDAGWQARLNDIPRTSNPCEPGTGAFKRWLKGWDRADSKLNAASDSDGSPEGRDGEAGSVRSTTARAEGIARSPEGDS